MNSKPCRRVAITGLGIISPLGNNVVDFFDNLIAGKSGTRRISADFSHQLSVKIAAEVNFDMAEYFSKKQIDIFDRTTQLAMISASQAWSDSGIELEDEEKKRAGVYIGTGMGGAQSLEAVYSRLYKKNEPKVSPRFVTKIMCNSSASHISMQYKLSGPCLTFSTACSSSSVAIGEAYRQIKTGYADIILAGGAESFLTYGSFKCWESLGVLAVEDVDDPSTSCRPFSKDRTGFVLGEGSAVLVLEEMEIAKKRGAKIYGELIGYGSNADASHITSPSVMGQAQAIRLSLEEARVNCDEIDYINAHGTATVMNDIVETQAIKNVFGEMAYKIPVSSTKSIHGHLMGASGAVELVAALLSIKNKVIPPTANYRVPDLECDLDYVPNHVRTGVKVKTVMSNSFAFGGTNAVIIAREV